MNESQALHQIGRPVVMSDRDNPKRVMRFQVRNKPIEVTTVTKGEGKYGLSRIDEVCGDQIHATPEIGCDGKPVAYSAKDNTNRFRVTRPGDYVLMFESPNCCDYTHTSYRELGVQHL